MTLAVAPAAGGAGPALPVLALAPDAAPEFGRVLATVSDAVVPSDAAAVAVLPVPATPADQPTQGVEGASGAAEILATARAMLATVAGPVATDGPPGAMSRDDSRVVRRAGDPAPSPPPIPTDGEPAEPRDAAPRGDAPETAGTGVPAIVDTVTTPGRAATAPREPAPSAPDAAASTSEAPSPRVRRTARDDGRTSDADDTARVKQRAAKHAHVEPDAASAVAGISADAAPVQAPSIPTAIATAAAAASMSPAAAGPEQDATAAPAARAAPSAPVADVSPVPPQASPLLPTSARREPAGPSGWTPLRGTGAASPSPAAPATRRSEPAASPPGGGAEQAGAEVAGLPPAHATVGPAPDPNAGSAKEGSGVTLPAAIVARSAAPAVIMPDATPPAATTPDAIPSSGVIAGVEVEMVAGAERAPVTPSTPPRSRASVRERAEDASPVTPGSSAPVRHPSPTRERPLDVPPASSSFHLSDPSPRAGSVADGPAAATTPADAAIANQLDLAKDGIWLNQLAHDVARSADASGHLRFSLAPEHLGRLDVALAQGADGTSIRLTAETREAHRIVADAQPRLVAEARAQGLRVSDTSVDLGGSRGGSAQPQAFGNQNARGEGQPRQSGLWPSPDAPAAVEGAQPAASGGDDLYA